MNNSIYRSLSCSLLLMALSFTVFFTLQTVAYRFGIFNTMGLNLAVLAVAVCILAICFGPLILSRLLSDAHERKLISVLSAVAFVGFTTTYAVVFPISLERSFSVRILVNLLNSNNQTLSKTQLEALHTRNQIYEMRYAEMSRSGLVSINGDQVKLLDRGKDIAVLYLLLGQSMGYSKGFNN